LQESLCCCARTIRLRNHSKPVRITQAFFWNNSLRSYSRLAQPAGVAHARQTFRRLPNNQHASGRLQQGSYQDSGEEEGGSLSQLILPCLLATAATALMAQGTYGEVRLERSHARTLSQRPLGALHTAIRYPLSRALEYAERIPQSTHN
jgi:hypothetical protein